MSQTLIEKIAQKFAVGLDPKHEVHAGDYLSIKPAYVMTHDNTGAVIPKFKSIGAKKLFNSRQVVVTLDHNVQDTTEKNLEKYKKIEDLLKRWAQIFILPEEESDTRLCVKKDMSGQEQWLLHPIHIQICMAVLAVLDHQ